MKSTSRRNKKNTFKAQKMMRWMLPMILHTLAIAEMLNRRVTDHVTVHRSLKPLIRQLKQS